MTPTTGRQTHRYSGISYGRIMSCLCARGCAVEQVPLRPTRARREVVRWVILVTTTGFGWQHGEAYEQHDVQELSRFESHCFGADRGEILG